MFLLFKLMLKRRWMIKSRIIFMISICLAFLIIWMIFLGLTMAFGPPFSMKFFYIVAKDRQFENVIVSPVVVQAALSCIYFGTGGNTPTAAEIKIGAQLEGSNKYEVSETYGRLLLNMQLKNFRVFNRFYIDERFEVLDVYKAYMKALFFATILNVNFTRSVSSALQNNEWLDILLKQNSHEIMPMIGVGLAKDTASVLVSVVYLEAKWLYNFDSRTTQEMDFFIDNEHSVKVDMMFQEFYFYSGHFKEIAAKGFEMPLLNTNLSMFILLPFELDGLEKMEQNLKHIDLSYLKHRLRERRIRVQLPKFHFKFNLEVEPILSELGIKSMFREGDDFSNMLLNRNGFKITHFRHLASIQIDEYGIDAAEASNSRVHLLHPPMPLGQSIADNFYINHPFFFAIKDDVNVYLSGHVTKF